MTQQLVSFLRDLKNLYLRYFLVGTIFLLWGIVYAFLALQGYDSPLISFIVFCAGFLTATLIWRAFEKKGKEKICETKVDVVPVIGHGGSPGVVFRRPVSVASTPPPLFIELHTRSNGRYARLPFEAHIADEQQSMTATFQSSIKATFNVRQQVECHSLQ